MSKGDVNTSNYKKFLTKNPVVKKLLGGFFEKLEKKVAAIGPATFLDAGCGEGETMERLKAILPKRPAGFDLNPDSVAFARERLPEADLSIQSIYQLPYADKSFELVICCEVLEHLDEPEKALEELARVSKKHLILTVPWEPWFQVGSFCRGKYLATMGNHPEHVNHWNPKSFEAFAGQYVDRIDVDTAFPWLMASCQVS